MKRRRFVALLMCCAFLTACTDTAKNDLERLPLISVSFQSSSDTEISEEPQEESEAVSSDSEFTVSLTNYDTDPKCKGYALFCVDDDQMLGGAAIDARIAPASLTKILTAAVALRYIDPNEVFTVGSEQDFVNENSSLSFIAPGQRLKLYDLVTAMMLPSGNDAAYTVAVSVARIVSKDPDMPDKQAVDYFCGLMNDMALELGMTNSHFADPDGWDNDEHYTTINDLIKLSKYALTVPVIREIAAMPTAEVVFESGETAIWYNSNQLLHPENDYYRENAIGLKTGSTDNAGMCIIAEYIDGGKTYIAIVVGSETDEDRYGCLMELFTPQ